MPDWSAIKAQLKDAGIATTDAVDPTPVSGGDISAAWHLPASDGGLFIKTGPLSAADMFGAEADGLAAIAASETIRVPAVISTGQTDAAAYLALEWLTLERSDETAERRLGERLAAMHRTTASHFGWHRDNTIGLTPQHNPVGDDWVTFYREQRLAFQLRLAAESGFTGELQEQGARLMKRLPIYFEDRPPSASLLHGDLWGGNWASCDGQPVVFDPAVYYGDRETDLAMTRLFGGFGPAFYDAYESTWPLPDGHYERRLLYQLYHVLNHLNLFGSAYLAQAMQLIDELH
jgi:protein-ribulosamine 3-kinase